jgi:hypothetical protein
MIVPGMAPHTKEGSAALITGGIAVYVEVGYKSENINFFVI